MNVLNTCPGALTGASSQLLHTLINALLVSHCALGPDGRYPPDYAPDLKHGEEFDFIVVGAGSAGSVVANRLSENSKWKVLLIEAGTYPSSTSEIPSVSITNQDTDEDWQYETLPSINSTNRKKGRCPRGKGLGGSSLLNFMIYFRGNRYDHDNWAKAGNIGWDYDSVTKYYEKFENHQLKITQNMHQHPIVDEIIQGFKTLQLYNEFNAENLIGFLKTRFTISNGTRSNSAKAFLSPIKDRKNLYVVLNAQVSRLLINAETREVSGVELRLNNSLIHVISKKEVILSAGTINSPQILMNSGIGPKNHLQCLGINLVKDLRVGDNLQDHVMFSGLFYNVGPKALHNQPDAIDSLYQYFMHRTGPLSGVTTGPFHGFINHKFEENRPSLQFYPFFYYRNQLSSHRSSKLHREHGVSERVTMTQQNQNQKSHNFHILPAVSYPKSKGRVLLRSGNPFDKPLIYPNHLGNDEDVQTLVEGIKIIQSLVKTDAMRVHKPELVKPELPECEPFIFDSDEYWACAVKHLSITIYHLAGTCKMGPKWDHNAVVDHRLRVYGVGGVRVVDASIMPNLVGANTNGPVTMIGEKGAEMIKEDWTLEHIEL
ncbi:hypothetical protein RN001_010747 [Aquatica leii]|uniref:Glucose-methanol-choline oxidoreductase N-terminal domain-containing protein n=1 Tax=Aquatica leii TaxID=1421715 RepID=A0AAN7PAB9_9COLE|nr:hypothetical protein RN001_010747 [Aquatica leii]